MKQMSYKEFMILMNKFTDARTAYLNAKADYLDKVQLVKAFGKAEGLSKADKDRIRKEQECRSLSNKDFDAFYNKNLIPITKAKLNIVRRGVMEKCIKCKKALKEAELKYLECVNQTKLGFGINEKVSG